MKTRGEAIAAWGLWALALLGCGDSASTPALDSTGPADVTQDSVTLDTEQGDTAPADTTPPRTELVVMSYNVMCSFCSFSEHFDWEWDWDARMPWIHDTVRRHDPDVIGVQELATIDGSHPDQILAVVDGDETYGAVFYRTQEGDTLPYDYPDATVYYRKSRFELLDEGAFWLSPTPDVAYTSGWNDGPAAPRLVAWATLRDRHTGRDLTFATTHFDNNAPNQLHSAPLSLERLAPFAAARPLIFVGDYNSRPNSAAYAILDGGVDGAGFALDNAYDHAPDAPRRVPAEGARTDWDPADRIDHIWFAGAAFTVSDWAVDLTPYGPLGQAASDHYAIVATLALP